MTPRTRSNKLAGAVARKAGAVAGGLALAGLVEVVTYRRWRPWCLNWGATEDEAGRHFAGDELLEDPSVVTTRAISVDAVPGHVFPWLLQMGPGRGGAYTYDWIENLAGLDMHSADSILPDYQDLEVGEVLALGARGPRLRVAILEPERSLVLFSEDGNWVWAFALVPGSGGTRLISRNRIRVPGDSPIGRAVYKYLMEPGSLVMERKMLLGIKQRAEAMAP
jgi:hypothetical protein